MNINSTDEERYNELKEGVIRIIQDTSNSSVTFGLNYNDKGEPQLWKDVHEFIVDELDIKNISININGFDFPVILNDNSISESIANTDKNKTALSILAKTFANINLICKNAVIIDIEKYKYYWKRNAANISSDYFFLSALKIKNEIYPIEIIIEERKRIQDTNFHLIISTDKIKEDVLMAGVHTDNAVESQSSQESSSTLTIPQFVQFLNKNHSVIIKHLPNEILSDYQKEIKNQSILYDKQRVEKIRQRDIERENTKKNKSK